MSWSISNEQFDELVAEALDSLPDYFLERLQNIEVVVAEWPSTATLRQMGMSNRLELLGLYEGVPLTERTSNYGLTPPDLITLFQRPIIAATDGSLDAVRAEVRHTVIHEIAHHFGISDERLWELGAY
jgi:predicted Zn-dependent protease with MMP-like domain